MQTLALNKIAAKLGVPAPYLRNARWNCEPRTSTTG